MSNKNFKNQNRRNYNQYANKEETTPVEEIEESIDTTETVEETEVVTEETEVIEDKTPDEVPKPVYMRVLRQLNPTNCHNNNPNNTNKVHHRGDILRHLQG